MGDGYLGADLNTRVSKARLRIGAACFRPTGTGRTASVPPPESADRFGPPSGPTTNDRAGPTSVWERR